jgi:hypothetical protein
VIPFLPDDAYYYLRIAQFGGFTFDGVNFTNGYHPLWMAVCVGLGGHLAPCAAVNFILAVLGLRSMRDAFHA